MFIEYTDSNTLAHRLDVRTKVIIFIGVIILAFLFNNPLFNLVLVLLLGVVALLIKIELKQIFNLIKPLVPVFVLIMLITGFTYTTAGFTLASSKRVLFYLFSGERLGFTLGGFLIGCSFLSRILIMIFASTILNVTTPIDDFLHLLNKIKVPYEISLIITIGIRFIPTMEKKKNMIFEAQRSRGAKLNNKGILGPIKSYLPIMVPMIINSIIMSNNLSMSMLIRGYGFSREFTSLKELHFTIKDYLILLIFTLILVFSFYIRFEMRLGLI